MRREEETGEVGGTDISFVRPESLRERLRAYLDFVFTPGGPADEVGARGVILFGSAARGEATDNAEHVSDVDLVLVAERLPANPRDRMTRTSEFTGAVRTGIHENGGLPRKSRPWPRRCTT
ncbi:MAG: hypothetical protein Kow0069_23930 [Promethearchaeota archaeon]